MKQRKILVYSIIAGLLGGILVGLYVYQVESSLQKSILDTRNPRMSAVIAIKDIPVDTIIRDDMVITKEIDEKAAIPMAFSCKEEMVGQITAEDIVKGEQLTAYQIKDKRANLSSRIPGKGLRALSLPVIGVNGLSGLLKPGDQIDILGTFKENLSSSYSGPTTYTLLQNVQVLAVGQSINRNSVAKNYNSVTVAVTPDESEILSLAINSGTVITLTLRSLDDDDIVELKKKKYKELFDIRTSLNKKRKDNLQSVEVIRRTEKKTEKVR